MLMRRYLISMGKIKLEGYVCEQYRHTWVPRETTTEEPEVCLTYKSQYWNTPRKSEREE